MEKPRRLIWTPTPADGTPTVVDIVERVAQYTEIVLVYAESGRAAIKST